MIRPDKMAKIKSFMTDFEQELGGNRLVAEDWDLLQKVYVFLQPFAAATLYGEMDTSSIAQSLELMDALLLYYEETKQLYSVEPNRDERILKAIDMG